jgi:hypothetical protein
MELYITNSSTERYGNAHIAQARACSENANHATIYTVGLSAEEAQATLMVSSGAGIAGIAGDGC